MLTVVEAGMAIALVLALPILNWYGMLIATNISPVPEILGLYIDQTFVAILFAIVIFTFGIQGGLLSRILGNKALVLGGEISFSIYLFHQILIIWATKHPRLLAWAPSQFRFGLMLILILALAYGIWRWFECPVRMWIRHRFGRL